MRGSRTTCSLRAGTSCSTASRPCRSCGGPREKGVEDEFGDFERGYDWWTYLRLLRDAGFEARKVRATHGYTSLADRLRLHPPLSWLNGTIYSVFTYVGRKPG